MAKTSRVKNRKRAAEMLRKLVDGECGEGLRRSALRMAERLEGRPVPRVRQIVFLSNS
jgi:hypothetical protein